MLLRSQAHFLQSHSRRREPREGHKLAPPVILEVPCDVAALYTRDNLSEDPAPLQFFFVIRSGSDDNRQGPTMAGFESGGRSVKLLASMWLPNVKARTS